MRRKELGVAVIGCGRIGSLRAKIAAEHPAVTFVALADRGLQRGLRGRRGREPDLHPADHQAIPVHGARGPAQDRLP